MHTITYLRGYGRKAYQAKSYALNKDGTLEKDNDIMYTRTWKSLTDKVETSEDLLHSLRRRSRDGYAMFTGSFSHTLKRENRPENTLDVPQQFLCIDIDGGPYTSVGDFMHDEGLPKAIRNTRCVVAYSNSHGIAKKGLAAHLFFLLDTPTPPRVVKQILTSLNLLTPRVYAWLTKTETPAGKTDMPLPIDPTMGQNNRIIYNAPPILKGGLADPFPNLEDRIWLYEPSDTCHDKLNISDLSLARHRRVNGAEDALNALLDAKGLTRPTTINGRTVDATEGGIEWVITDVQRDSDEFVRCNVNGTVRSPWFFRNAPISPATLMYSQNPADVPFFITKKAPRFTELWNGSDDLAGVWAENELKIGGYISPTNNIMLGAARTPPDFMWGRKV